MAVMSEKRAALGFVFIEIAILTTYFVGFILPNWTLVTVDTWREINRASMGIWSACGFDHDIELLAGDFYHDQCISLLEVGVPGWVRATQAFAVLGLFFGVVCVVLSLVMALGPWDEDVIFKVFLPIWYIGGFCMLVTIIIYGASLPPREHEIPRRGIGNEYTITTIRWKFRTGFVLEAIAACLWNAFGFVFLCAVCCT
ncbi:uncharacterized protein [Haliotis asinina]|uniref:uncharacterized protein n=1 Tax=Haliotis asinina TaxID=109174 RepID=UPI003531BB95